MYLNQKVLTQVESGWAYFFCLGWVGSAIFGLGLGLENSLWVKNNFFGLGKKNISCLGQKVPGSASYLQRVKSMLGTVWVGSVPISNFDISLLLIFYFNMFRKKVLAISKSLASC